MKKQSIHSKKKKKQFVFAAVASVIVLGGNGWR